MFPVLAMSYLQIRDGGTSRLCSCITQPRLLRVTLFLVYSSAHLPRTDSYPIISTMTHHFLLLIHVLLYSFYLSRVTSIMYINR